MKKVGRLFCNLLSKSGRDYSVFKVYVLNPQADNNLSQHDAIITLPHGSEVEIFPTGTSINDVFAKEWTKIKVEDLKFNSLDIIKFPEEENKNK